MPDPVIIVVLIDIFVEYLKIISLLYPTKSSVYIYGTEMAKYAVKRINYVMLKMPLGMNKSKLLIVENGES